MGEKSREAGRQVMCLSVRVCVCVCVDVGICVCKGSQRALSHKTARPHKLAFCVLPLQMGMGRGGMATLPLPPHLLPHTCLLATPRARECRKRPLCRKRVGRPLVRVQLVWIGCVIAMCSRKQHDRGARAGRAPQTHAKGRRERGVQSLWHDIDTKA